MRPPIQVPVHPPSLTLRPKGARRESLLLIVRNLWLAYLMASILILYGFRWSLPNAYQTKSFQGDETVAVEAVNQIHSPRFNPHEFRWGTGLYYQVYLVKLLSTAGGRVPVGNLGVLVMGRLVVFASALGALTVVFLLGRQMYDTWTGRLAAIILSVLPGFVINAHYFKADVPMTFWVLAATWAAYRLIETGDSRYALGLGLLVGYTASVKYSGGVLFPAGCVALAIASRKFQRRLPWISFLGCVGLGFVLGEPAALLPRGWGAIVRALRGVAALNREGAPYHLVRPPAWIDYPLNVLPFALTLPMLLTAVAALVWVLARERGRFLPILTFLAAYYPLLAIDNWRLVRYTVPLLPFAALFVASLLGRLRQRRAVGTAAVAAGCALIGYAFLFSWSYVRVMGQVDPRIQAARWIQQHLPADQPIPAVPESYWDTGQLDLIGYQKLDVDFDVPSLAQAASPYLITSESGTLYLQALDYYPRRKQFFTYVKGHYTEVVHFENSQKLLFIDSKRGSTLPQDWLHPNPRITILIRRAG